MRVKRHNLEKTDFGCSPVPPCLRNSLRISGIPELGRPPALCGPLSLGTCLSGLLQSSAAVGRPGPRHSFHYLGLLPVLAATAPTAPPKARLSVKTRGVIDGPEWQRCPISHKKCCIVSARREAATLKLGEAQPGKRPRRALGESVLGVLSENISFSLTLF